LRTDIAPSVRDVLRTYFDAITLSEPAQFKLWRSAGLTLAQFGALRQLRDSTLPAGELASRLGVSATSLTRVLDRLEKRKLVERARDRLDRRRIAIILLPRGRRLLEAVSVLEGTAIHKAVEDLRVDERRQLVALLGRLIELARVHAVEGQRQPRRRGRAAA
jgi:DNA-binding MarR family transcriptional regulator